MRGWEPRECALDLSRVVGGSDSSWHRTKREHKCNNTFTKVVKIDLGRGVAEAYKWGEKTCRSLGKAQAGL